jgi:hypothetical protein
MEGATVSKSERGKPHLVRSRATGQQAATTPNQVASAADLLDRLERQAEDLARTKVRLDQVEAALRAERDTRQRLTTMLSEERSRSAALEDERRQRHDESSTQRRVGAQLEQEQAKVRELERRLEEDWREIHVLRSEVVDARRWWSRRRDGDQG